MRFRFVRGAAESLITPNWTIMAFVKIVAPTMMTTQSELNLTPDKPTEIIAQGTAEFYDVYSRADAGEFVIEWLESMRSKDGKNNAVWKFKVRYD